MNKQSLFQHISETIAGKIARLQQDIADLQKDIAEDSKSSAGDKFETSREMAQQELGKLSLQLIEQQRLKGLVESQTGENTERVQAGSLVRTDKGFFLIGIPIGKIHFREHEITGIGIAAPLGQLLLNKGKNEQVQFNMQSYRIEEIY